MPTDFHGFRMRGLLNDRGPGVLSPQLLSLLAPRFALSLPAISAIAAISAQTRAKGPLLDPLDPLDRQRQTPLTDLNSGCLRWVARVETGDPSMP